MIKIIIYIIGALLILIPIAFVVMSLTAAEPDRSLVDGKLRPCSDKPNCVCSEHHGNEYSKIAPISLKTGASDIVEKIKSAVASTGGQVQEANSNYVWATYVSDIFRFTDDVEFRIDSKAGVIHLRSASRSGHSDMGVNRKRVEAIKAAFN